MKKYCVECQMEFTCLAYEGKCWCENLKIEPETLEELRNKYTQCLCPDCLDKYKINENIES